MENKILQIATFGGGCFWCVEAVFKELKGVGKVISGYAGGPVKNPTYRQVCDGETGHAEVAQIEFDPSVISYETLVEVFFLAHDPTTLNRQGNDVGAQYRSFIFHHTDEQKKIAEAVKSRIEKEKIYRNPIVTEIAPFANFYAAEDYHQNYYEENPQQPYCRVVIDPKVTKFRQKFKELLK
ncbi:peptide-methionine (S)-S-oxide reductase MsrA [Candidatus Acetothermia bacterium]|nr:peptide-methionine (S)-S-oxide reductase MsrA [Candidatus Acetothermia bacterium]